MIIKATRHEDSIFRLIRPRFQVSCRKLIMRFSICRLRSSRSSIQFYFYQRFRAHTCFHWRQPSSEEMRPCTLVPRPGVDDDESSELLKWRRKASALFHLGMTCSPSKLFSHIHTAHNKSNMSSDNPSLCNLSTFSSTTLKPNLQKGCGWSMELRKERNA